MTFSTNLGIRGASTSTFVIDLLSLLSSELMMMWDKDSVKQLRQFLELTQMEFAELLGCRQQTISEWEQGLYAPANAYGKLLSQIQLRTPVFERPQKDEVELFNEPQYNRPFDPAID